MQKPKNIVYDPKTGTWTIDGKGRVFASQADIERYCRWKFQKKLNQIIYHPKKIIFDPKSGGFTIDGQGKVFVSQEHAENYCRVKFPGYPIEIPGEKSKGFQELPHSSVYTRAPWDNTFANVIKFGKADRW